MSKVHDIKKHFDMGSLIVITITFMLFISALFTKGFTHEILLEAAVFLVSVKLIMTGLSGLNIFNLVNVMI